MQAVNVISKMHWKAQLLAEVLFPFLTDEERGTGGKHRNGLTGLTEKTAGPRQVSGTLESHGALRVLSRKAGEGQEEQ